MRAASCHRRWTAGILLPALACAGLAPGGALAEPAAAATPPSSFDGSWVIDATTSSFFCPVKKKRLVAVVQGGQVKKLTGVPAAASGQIGPDGGVSFVLKLLGVTATVRGRMNGGTGAGDWSSNSFICARGGWRAAHAGN